jgi:hypothetical protein
VLCLHCQLTQIKPLPLLQHRFCQQPTSTLHGETTKEESNFKVVNSEIHHSYYIASDNLRWIHSRF